MVVPVWFRSQTIVFVFGAWVFIVLAALSILGQLNYEYYFVFCLIGFLVTVELFGPYTTQQWWRSRINVIIFFCIIVFTLVAVNEINLMRLF